jgi:V8-like Glu-specific endopeptidase
MELMRRTLLVVLGLTAVALLSLAASAEAAPSKTLDPSSARSFWTPKRMARAVPLDQPADTLRAEGSAAKLPPVPHYQSQAVQNPSAQPYPAVGKVFFKIDGRIYVCSASIVHAPSRSLVWTAGHCVRDAGRNGKFATKWIFVPGYERGARPYGTWPAKIIVTTRGWAHNNQHYDYAAAVIKRQGGTGVEDAVGSSLPMGANSTYEQSWDAVGYPQAPIWRQRLWQCSSGFYRRDSLPGSGPDPFGIGCDMTGGSSGGPWINEAGELGAVTSYGYNHQPDAIYGTYLGNAAARLYQQLRDKH